MVIFIHAAGKQISTMLYRKTSDEGQWSGMGINSTTEEFKRCRCVHCKICKKICEPRRADVESHGGLRRGCEKRKVSGSPAHLQYGRRGAAEVEGSPEKVI